MDSSGFIQPPPGLVPPRHDTSTQTERMPQRAAELPAFNPPAGASAPAERPRSWLVVLPTGARVPVGTALLVGRNPVRFEPWTSAGLLPVDDPDRTVSKTHAVLESTAEGIRVTDLHSTNGVSILDASGAATDVAPGVAVPLAAGTTVLCGSYRLRVVAA